MASYFVNDTFEMRIEGLTLVDALRARIEQAHAGTLENVFDDEPSEARGHLRDLEGLAAAARAACDDGRFGDALLVGRRYTMPSPATCSRAPTTASGAPACDASSTSTPPIAIFRRSTSSRGDLRPARVTAR